MQADSLPAEPEGKTSCKSQEQVGRGSPGHRKEGGCGSRPGAQTPSAFMSCVTSGQYLALPEPGCSQMEEASQMIWEEISNNTGNCLAQHRYLGAYDKASWHHWPHLGSLQFQQGSGAPGPPATAGESQKPQGEMLACRHGCHGPTVPASRRLFWFHFRMPGSWLNGLYPKDVISILIPLDI